MRILDAIQLTLFFLMAPALSLFARAAPSPAAPLPDITTLLRGVEQHQAELDRAREEYTFRQHFRLTFYDKHGKVKRTEDHTSNVFFVHGHPIETRTSKDGKALSPDDLKKEQDHAAKDAMKYASQPDDHADKDDVSVTRLLAITKFANPRRVVEGERSLIAVDFDGDPHAKAHGRNEEAIKRVHGTVWIDEAAREVARMQASFDEPLRIGFGLFATLDRGSSFSFEQALINHEAWLPTSVHGRFDGKAALFVGFHVELSIRFDQYEKFHASTTEQIQTPHTP